MMVISETVDSNEEMVERLAELDHIETERVKHAFLHVDRKDFVPPKYGERAYTDGPVPISGGATVSAPHMVATNTELLEVEPDDRVLEIGSGSGYQLAILAELAEEAVGVEVKPELVEKSRERLEHRENVNVHEGNGFEPVEGKFDRILFSCAVGSLEEAKEYLKEDGVIVAPVETASGQVLKRWKNGELEEHMRVRFVPFEE